MTVPPLARAAVLVVTLVFVGLATPVPAAAAAPPSLTTTRSVVPAPHVEADVPLLWATPFVLMLAAIALMPFVARHFWERHYPKVSFALAGFVALYYFAIRGSAGPWLHEMQEYVSFIILLGSLYVVSGGIAIRVNRRATPAANATLLLLGAALANVFGTTGAAMLLIRPYLRMNRKHIKPYHVVFFIFAVANVGGSLTPIGDPPLFLGYLKGVPFWWVFEHMKAPWLFTVGLVVAVFTVVDVIDHRRAPRDHDGAADAGPQANVLGAQNFLFIAVILYAVFRPSLFDAGAEFLAAGATPARFLDMALSREILMLAAAVASRRLTRPGVYVANDFTFGPIKEVAILFVGIFSTMVPALQWLEHNAKERLPVHTPGHFYYASGALSSVLDNAPTYLTFLKMRLGELDHSEVDEAEAVLVGLRGKDELQFDPKQLRSERAVAAVRAMIKYHDDDVRRGTTTREELEVAFLLGLPALNVFIVAISAGSVFWGACTYIGNGPNFMVKSIADAAGVKTPGFLEYVYKYTLPVLIPIYVLVWLVFFFRH